MITPKTFKKVLIGLALLIVIVVFYLLIKTNDKVTVLIPTGELDVYLADNAFEYAKGLSGTKLDTLDADGMLFVFDDSEEREFWMNQMNYDLDVIWITDGLVKKIDESVPAPEDGESPVYMSSSPFLVDMVLELPAGEAYEIGLVEGHRVSVE